MRYRKKPVVIEAVQIVRIAEDGEFSVMGYSPGWLAAAVESGFAAAGSEGAIWTKANGHLMIGTKEGELRVEPGAWIIRGIEGEIYPCADSVFRATYDPVDGGEA